MSADMGDSPTSSPRPRNSADVPYDSPISACQPKRRSSQLKRRSSHPGCAGHRILIIPPLRDIKTANSPAGVRWSNSSSSCRTHPASAGQRIMNIAFWRHLCEVSKVKRVCLKRPARFMTWILAHLAELILPLQGRGL